MGGSASGLQPQRKTAGGEISILQQLRTPQDWIIESERFAIKMITSK